MSNAPVSGGRRRVEPATTAQDGRIVEYGQRGTASQRRIAAALSQYEQRAGAVSRGQATAVLSACESGRLTGFVRMLLREYVETSR